MDFFKRLFESDFMPHGHCYYWKPEIVYTNAISDGMIAVAYLTIPLSLFYIVRIRKDFRYYWLLVLFAVFILGCGTTHVMDVINIWKPYYRLDSVIRAITALASIGTAVVLIRFTPRILTLPNADFFKNYNDELMDLNKTLEEKVHERTLDLFHRETELNELTEKLKEREAKLKLITDTIPAYIAYIDKDEVYQFSNKYYKKTLKSSIPDILGAHVKEVLGANSYKVSQPYIQQALKGHECTFENVVQKTDGSTQILNISYVPDVTEKGVEGFVVMAVDISDRIEHENQLKLKNKELLKINNDLDNFIYTASHDLKSPISNMEGLLITIRDEISHELYGEIREMFEMLEQSVIRLKGTIAELANISQIQKNIDEDQSSLSIEEFITDFKKDYSQIIKETGTDIENYLTIQRVYYSQRNFRSILYNILSNAIKYRKVNEKPLITIKTESLENDVTLMSITDNGLGLDSNQKEKIFGMFKRFHTHVEGSGIGLYIVKRIIENSGDQIEVESEIGKGTVFRIYFKNQNKINRNLIKE